MANRLTFPKPTGDRAPDYLSVVNPKLGNLSGENGVEKRR